ncbi:thioredoxin family protein [Crocinitomix algicola]|uniref:thioredoxin family protein n=1 Tax=Crocinitomix algicola TaxID=1740263 RepID=UPI000871FC32|nr:DUF255 domain-containing protein [Crocinitomix algicola]
MKKGIQFALFLTGLFFLTSLNTPSVILIENESEPRINFFEGDWNAALVKAKKEGKLIFVDAYASWCGPCKMMDRKTFNDEAVAQFFNAKFINYKMDMEKHPEGARLAKKYNLTLYPTLYFLDHNEEIIHYALGYHKPKHLLEVADEALKK